MKFQAFVFVCMLGAAAALSFDSKSKTTGPIEKIVKLLEDMKTQLEKDKKTERKMYEKYVCWCDKVLSNPPKEIVVSKHTMYTVNTDIIGDNGRALRLRQEIADLEAAIKANEKAQSDATKLRGKNNAAFVDMQAETKEAMIATQKALKVLIDATLEGKSALVQQGAQTRSRMAVHNVLEKLPTHVSMPMDAMSLLGDFTGDAAGYAPQSATIQGILVDMYSTMAADLQSAFETEGKQNRDFETFIDNKQKEKEALEKEKQKKENELAETEKEIADEEETYEVTDEDRIMDVDFFDATKESCIKKWEEFKIREQMRAEEMSGIVEALKILSKDSFREVLGRAIKPGKETGVVSFIQQSIESSEEVKAYKALKAQSTRHHSLRLAMLAVHIRTTKAGHFGAVLKEIDNMMDTLKAETQADIEKKDECIAEYQEIDKKVSDYTWKMQVSDAKIDKLEALIELKDEDKHATIVEIEETEDEIEEMKNNRQAEHAAWESAKKDDEDAIAILEAALAELTKFYAEQKIDMGPLEGVEGYSLVSTENSAKQPAGNSTEFVPYVAPPPPDATFSDKGSRKLMSKGIVSMMTYLIQDLNHELLNDAAAESALTAQYQTDLAVAEKRKETLEAKKVSLEQMIAVARQGIFDEGQTKEGYSTDRKAQEDYRKAIKTDCDWIMSVFDERAEKRAAEMAGLTEAKALLSGAKAASLLQKYEKGFDAKDNSKLASIRFLGMKK